MSNKQAGTDFENALAKYLSSFGYWVHNMAQNKSGQPADLIAVKDQKALLIDCKDCKTNRFTFSRIESNQDSAMTLWSMCHNDYGWFALRLLNGSIYMLSHRTMSDLRVDKKSLNEEDIKLYGLPVFDWVRSRA